jgi:hypothetical protein
MIRYTHHQFSVVSRQSSVNYRLQITDYKQLEQEILLHV